jgi:hypothetical protein
MGLPYTRNRSFQAGVSDVDGKTLNDLQDDDVKFFSLVGGEDFVIADEFTGDSLNRVWRADAGVTILNDVAIAGAAQGCAQLANTGAAVQTSQMSIGTRDWRFRTRLKLPDYATGAAMNLIAGIYSLIPAQGVHFILRRDAGATFNIEAKVGADAAVNTGVAVPVASYKSLEIRKTGSKIEFFIDDILVYTKNGYVTSQDAVHISVWTQNNSASGRALLDYVKAVIWRTGAPGSAVVPAGHEEGGVVAMSSSGSGDGVDYKDVTFAVPYPAGYTYQFFATPGLAGANDDTVAVAVVNRTQNGMRLKPSAPFDGVISWGTR